MLTNTLHLLVREDDTSVAVILVRRGRVPGLAYSKVSNTRKTQLVTKIVNGTHNSVSVTNQFALVGS